MTRALENNDAAQTYLEEDILFRILNKKALKSEDSQIMKELIA
jgi:hypothetical protein